MDAPIGAMGDGFGERLVLEEKSQLGRWGGCLLYLLMIPFALLGAVMASLLLVTAFEVCFGLQAQGAGGFVCWSVFCLFVPMAYYLYEEYRSRDFQEVALCEGRLEVVGGAGDWRSAELLDVKVWPSGLSFASDRGERLTVRVVTEDHRKAVLEGLLPRMVAAQRQVLESAGEIRLYRDWRPLGKALLRALLVGGLMGLLCCLVRWQLGVFCGLSLIGLMLVPLLRDFWGAGLILTRTGMRGLRDSAEVPWSEVESCWTGDYFQEVLRVGTRRGVLTLVSARNPLVWALLIQELRAAEP
ncbi:MAG: hypothetical protein J0I12_18260 [Candidatus Eremiobacteraeota bacterium]|nr:hypothetical protein [Candidatus Eremiobacteraeota bacterium]